MSYRMNCPHCAALLNVTEVAFGKTVPCPGCNRLVSVPAATQTSAPPPAPPRGLGAGGASSYSPSGAGVPPGMPPVPEPGSAASPAHDPLDFLNSPAPDQAPTAFPEKKPLGLVWIIFFLVFQGVAMIVFGLMSSAGSGFVGSMSRGMGSRSEFAELAMSGAIGGLVLEALGLFLFHLGLLTLVACYGLWTQRPAGFSLARGLAIAYTVITLLAVIVCLYTRVGILSALIGLILWAGVTAYLFEGLGSGGRLKGYYSHLQRF